MNGFFKGIPESIEEAARIDGCSRIGVLLKITIPLSLPGIASAAIFSAIWSWNAYLFPLVLSNINTRPATVHVARFISFESINWGQLAASGVLVTLPIIFFGLFVQRGFVRGLTMGAMKE
jgi:multiple sugar transport system permease protein